MGIQDEMEQILNEKYNPEILVIENESDMHSGPKGRESHFKVLIVSDFFKGMNTLERQKHVYQALSEVMPQIHALSLRVLLSNQKDNISGFVSPECLHKTKS